MNGFEEIDWEAAIDLAKRFGGIVIFLLFMLAARRKKKALRRDRGAEPPPTVRPEAPPLAVPPIKPGDDATKLASEYSSGDVA